MRASQIYTWGGNGKKYGLIQRREERNAQPSIGHRIEQALRECRHQIHTAWGASGLWLIHQAQIQLSNTAAIETTACVSVGEAIKSLSNQDVH